MDEVLFAYRKKRHAYRASDLIKLKTRRAVNKILQRAAVIVAGMGFDVSAWQTEVNFQIAQAQNLKFVWIRALNGLAVDTRFAQHWAGSQGQVKRGAYLYYRDGVDPVLQAIKLREVCGADTGELPPMLDIEEVGNATLTASKIKLCAEELTRQFGKSPVIYTGFYVWRDAVTGDKTWAANYKLVIAAYPLVGWQDNYPQLVLNYPPMIPYPWVKWYAWQWTAYAPAEAYGVSGTYVDLEYASEEMGVLLDETPPPPQGEEIVINFKTLYNLVTRQEGKYGAPITGSLPINTVFPALDVNVDTPNSVWLKYAENQWVALVHAGIKRCQKENVTPCGENIPMTPAQETLLNETAAKVARLSTITPTHRVNRLTGSGKIKGRGVEDGEELVDIKHNASLEYVDSQDTSVYVRVMLGAFPVIVAISTSDWENYVVSV